MWILESCFCKGNIRIGLTFALAPMCFRIGDRYIRKSFIYNNQAAIIYGRVSGHMIGDSLLNRVIIMCADADYRWLTASWAILNLASGRDNCCTSPRAVSDLSRALVTPSAHDETGVLCLVLPCRSSRRGLWGDDDLRLSVEEAVRHNCHSDAKLLRIQDDVASLPHLEA
jgi:hypothetical protein